MVDERDTRRTVVLKSDLPFREGDDVPELDSDAPDLGADAPRPVTLESMARYLKSLTSGQSNRKETNPYPISEDHSVYSLNDQNGDPTRLTTGQAGAEATFDMLGLLDSMGVVGSYFSKDEIDALRDPKLGLHDLLLRIVPSAQGDATVRSYDVTGQATFPDPAGSGPVQQRISDVLKRNRFHPGPSTPFVPGGTGSGTGQNSIDSRPIGRAQYQLGRYIGNESDANSATVTLEDMKKVGLALMLRAAGEFVDRDGDPTNAGVGAAALLPGEAQLAATKVSSRALLASSLSPDQGAPAGLARRRTMESDLVFGEESAGSISAGSYGSLNTFLEPFAGFAPVGMAGLGAALVVAVKVAIEAFFGIFAVFGKADVIDNTMLPNSPYTIRSLGSSTFRERGRLAGGLLNLRDFGITPVRHDFLTAVNRGIDVFFQFDGTSFVRVEQSPGYYVVLVRAIIRSGGEIVRSITDAVSQASPIGAVQSILGVVDLLKSSKIVGFLNVLAAMGDNIITLEKEGFIVTNPLGVPVPGRQLAANEKISTVDRLVDNAATHVMKSRASRHDLPLAWRTSSTPSLYLLPVSAIRGAGAFGRGADPVLALASQQGAVISQGSGAGGSVGRIPADDAREIEDRLDAEYVPFYFHDLRTNEFVSFHAFLSAVNDSFSANYESDDPVGRVDPVMIYKNTRRTINLSFWIVSTGPEDFDAMWWKINKLTTLLYPQWSRGRKLVVGQDTFIQPFSQMPTASPMVRLRLGDVLRTNYSRFALARLFGLGTQDFALSGTTQSITDDRARRLLEEEQKLRIRMSPVGATFEVDGEQVSGEGEYEVGDRAFLRPHDGPPAEAKSLGLPKIPGTGGSTKALLGSTAELRVEVTDTGAATFDGTVKNAYEVRVINPPTGFRSGPYVVSFDDLSIDGDYVREVALQNAGLSESQTPEQEAVETFFSPEKNVVVRSFESTAGRGLAGFVTSMNMDWKSPTWETTRFGARAPQWAQVTMTFAPIHDIAPGLDADGFNRAPIYNVGGAVRRVGLDPHIESSADLNFEEQHAEARRTFNNDPVTALKGVL